MLQAFKTASIRARLSSERYSHSVPSQSFAAGDFDESMWCLHATAGAELACSVSAAARKITSEIATDFSIFYAVGSYHFSFYKR